MGFFKRTNNNSPLIPPVAPTPGQQAAAQRGPDPYAARTPARDPYATGASDPYAARNGGGGFNSHPNAGASNPYGNMGGGAGGNFNRAGPANASNEAARAELFGGLQNNPGAPRQAQQQRQWGYEGRELEEDFDEDEEIEGIKQEMRQTKMDSLASTRNALRLAREAEDTARGTIGRLADQSERLADSERHLDIAKANSQRAEDKANELKVLNRSIFRPAIVWNKDAKRAAQEQKIMNRHNMEREDRMKALSDVQDTRRRLGQATDTRGAGQQIVAGKMKQRAEARKRFQFDATASDDELEDEIDENLDETLEVTRRLKTLAGAMGEEVTKQNNRIGVITDKTDKLSYQVVSNTERLKMIK